MRDGRACGRRAGGSAAAGEAAADVALPAAELGLNLLALLFRRPLVNVGLVASELDISFQTANVLVGRLEELGLLQEITGAPRGRIFRYEPYVQLLREPEPAPDQIVEPETTEAAAAPGTTGPGGRPPSRG